MENNRFIINIQKLALSQPCASGKLKQIIQAKSNNNKNTRNVSAIEG